MNNLINFTPSRSSTSSKSEAVKGTKKYVLNIRGHKFSMSNGAYNNPSANLDEHYFFDNLADAFTELLSFGDTYFDKEEALKRRLPFHISFAGIITPDQKIVIIKRKVSPRSKMEMKEGVYNACNHLPEGIFIELNRSIFSVSDFEKETGYRLSGAKMSLFIKKNHQINYFLLVENIQKKK